MVATIVGLVGMAVMEMGTRGGVIHGMRRARITV
jgi:hypothetical protein